jgi:hypothetical protein
MKAYCYKSYNWDIKPFFEYKEGEWYKISQTILAYKFNDGGASISEDIFKKNFLTQEEFREIQLDKIL